MPATAKTIAILLIAAFVGSAQIIINPATGGAAGTCAALGGDVTGTCAANSVVKVNGAAVPASATVVGTNSSRQAIAATTAGTGTTVVLSVSPAITGVPTAPTPASSDTSTTLATTAFVKAQTSALTPSVSVQAATTAVLATSPTYNNGTAGVGATITGGSNGALGVIDGYTTALGDRILVKTQASALQNGVYLITTIGNGGNPYVLTRAVDFNTIAEINGSGAIPVLNGTTNNNTLWVLDTAIAAIGTGQNNINYNLGATTPFPALTITNATSTGTTTNKLVKLTGAPSTGVITGTSDTSGAIGICVANCGTVGAGTIIESGIGGCIFDGATTAGDYVQISGSVAGDCHDSGSTFPTSGMVLGRVLTTNAAGGTFSVLLFSPDVAAVSAKTIASGTSALGTSAISSNACATVVTTSATGVLTTDNIMADFNSDPSAVTGYVAGSMLTIIKYPTANNVNFLVCNNTSGSLTPGARTLNWRVVR